MQSTPTALWLLRNHIDLDATLLLWYQDITQKFNPVSLLQIFSKWCHSTLEIFGTDIYGLIEPLVYGNQCIRKSCSREEIWTFKALHVLCQNKSNLLYRAFCFSYNCTETSLTDPPSFLVFSPICYRQTGKPGGEGSTDLSTGGGSEALMLEPP